MIRKNGPPHNVHLRNNDPSCWLICCVPCILISGFIVDLFRFNSCVDCCNCKYKYNYITPTTTPNIYNKYKGKIWGIK